MRMGSLRMGLLALAWAAPLPAAIELDMIPARRPDAGLGSGARRPPEAEEFGLLELANGDRFRAALRRFEPDAGRLSFEHPQMEGWVRLEAAALRRFTARPRRNAEGGALPWVVELVNGDRWRADAPERTEERELLFETLSAGAIRVPWNRVRSLDRVSDFASLYEGPTPGETWISQQQRQVQFRDGGLAVESGNALGRTLPRIPRVALIEFTRSASLPSDFHVVFYAQSPLAAVDGNPAGYLLTLRGPREAMLERRRPGQPLRLGSAGMTWGQMQPQEIRFTLYVHLDLQRIWLYAEGRKIGEWTDPLPFPDPGNAISFGERGGTSILSRLRVAPWDGRLPPDGDPRAGGRESLLLESGDLLSGEIVRMNRESVVLLSPMGEIVLPLERILRIYRMEDGAPPDPPSPLASRLHWLDGTVATLELLGIEDGEIRAANEIVGEVRFPVSAVGRLIWRPSREEGVDP